MSVKTHSREEDADVGAWSHTLKPITSTQSCWLCLRLVKCIIYLKKPWLGRPLKCSRRGQKVSLRVESKNGQKKGEMKQERAEAGRRWPSEGLQTWRRHTGQKNVDWKCESRELERGWQQSRVIIKGARVTRNVPYILISMQEIHTFYFLLAVNLL